MVKHSSGSSSQYASGNGDDELDSVVQEDDIEDHIDYICSNSSSHPSTSSSNNIAVGVLIGVVDDDDGNDDGI